MFISGCEWRVVCAEEGLVGLVWLVLRLETGLEAMVRVSVSVRVRCFDFKCFFCYFSTL